MQVELVPSAFYSGNIVMFQILWMMYLEAALREGPCFAQMRYSGVFHERLGGGVCEREIGNIMLGEGRNTEC